MSRRSSRPRQTSAARTHIAPATAITPASPCPCGLSATYADCCGRLHAGSAAPTCEALMRSRYAAFVVQDAAYLLRTWDPDTRPPVIDFDPAMRWVRLEILATTDGSAFHTTGTVTFRAHYTHDGRPDSLHEQSRFVRHQGAWVYSTAVFAD
ncbi:YchJ family metal-binding protein [Streptomyces sp. NBC_01230]|uniref:YchJ family protein n=1 Tax=unclassified Streptomyces TaxID=2593676 RepID=UPI000B81013E|nr:MULTISPECIES: YchJ family metal-binding protein [unclassified Streptomyces]WSQ25990.1 YchJ family metal-binding protein [Streptomyces sp. NBC_01230]